MMSMSPWLKYIYMISIEELVLSYSYNQEWIGFFGYEQSKKVIKNKTNQIYKSQSNINFKF